MAGDATGFSTKRYVKWYDARKRRKKRKAFRKLHDIVHVKSKAILSMHVTNGTRNDSPYLKMMLKSIPYGEGDLCLDRAYLSRENCNLIAKKGRTPYIKPKSSTRVKARGSQAWRSMIRLYRADREEFDKHYHKRSIAEVPYSVIKRVFGYTLTSLRWITQRIELFIKVIIYNIDIAIKEQVYQLYKG